MKQLFKILTIGSVIIGFSVLTGCNNTIHGAGQDLQNIGSEMNPPKKTVHHHKKQTQPTTSTPATSNTSITTTETTTSDTVQTNMSGMPINTGSSNTNSSSSQ